MVTRLAALLAVAGLASPAVSIAPEPQQVGVGIVVRSLTSVSVDQQLFDADFFLYFDSEKSDVEYKGSCPPTNEACPVSESIPRVLVNAKDDVTVSTVNKIVGKTNRTSQYRVQGSFVFNSYVANWPFETESLQITVEDPRRSNQSLVFTSLATTLAPTVLAPGWQLHSATNRTSVTTNIANITYAPGVAGATGLSFSRFTTTVLVSRPWLNSVLKYLLPPLFILLIQLFSFAIGPSSVVTRISIVGSGLTAAVLFHVNSSQATPPSPYLMFVDRFMIAHYFVIVLNGIIAVTILKFKQREAKEKEAETPTPASGAPARRQRRRRRCCACKSQHGTPMSSVVHQFGELVVVFLVPALAVSLALQTEPDDRPGLQAALISTGILAPLAIISVHHAVARLPGLSDALACLCCEVEGEDDAVDGGSDQQYPLLHVTAAGPYQSLGQATPSPSPAALAHEGSAGHLNSGAATAVELGAAPGSIN